MAVRADIVVLGAGTLGSTEILLRSQNQGLSGSKMVGQHFSGNGDVLGFSYNNDRPINGIGFGKKIHGSVKPVGPTITSIIDNRNIEDWRKGWVIEEGAIPGGLAAHLPAVFSLVSGLEGENTEHGVVDWLKEKYRVVAGWAEGAYHGALHNTETYLGMCHDGSDGQMTLNGEYLQLAWSRVGDEPIIQSVNNNMEKATVALGGTFVRDPVWTEPFRKELISVHPLGGCVMADNAEEGAVNHKGQVFSGSSGTEVHKGLYVTDGSTVPMSIGVNPLLTISALAERTMHLMAEDYDWSMDVMKPSSPPRTPQRSEPLGVEFSECMRGFFSKGAESDATPADETAYMAACEAGAAKGKKDGTAMNFVLTIQAKDVNTFVSNPKHAAPMFGTVDCDALAPGGLTIDSGTFHLFVKNPREPDTKNMIYSMVMRTKDGKPYYFHGYKVSHHDTIWHLWHQNTTLYVTVYEGEDAEGAIVGRAVLHIKVADFLKLLDTIKVTGAHNELEKVEAVAKLGEFFGGTLLETYDKL